MSEPNRCPECGAALPAGALGGLCPKCLLAAGLESRDEPGSASGGGSQAPTTPHSGSFVPPDASWLAAHFPQLEISELLGHGGMGAVYKARQPKLDRLVALKIIRPESADDPAFAERFNREARMLARLSHPHIVGVYDFGSVDISLREMDPHADFGELSRVEREDYTKPTPLYFFLMEYVDGTNLRQLLQSGELLPQQALAIVPQICEALQFAHDEGVVHRDIKPENILLDKRGRVKIADFGLAKLAASGPQEFTLTGTHQVMGTPRYMAPEQMEGSHAVDHRADIYSLGVVFYEMLTGEVPMGHFDPPSKKVKVDVRLDEVVLRTLAREPQRRYQHASEVRSEIELISKSAPLLRAKGEARDLEDDGEIVVARQQLQFPAIGLLVLGIVTLPMAARAFFLRYGDRLLSEEPLQAMFGLALFVPPLAVIVGATKMLQLASYRWAVAASVLVMISPAALEQRHAWWIWWLCVLIGVWSLVVLSKPEVKNAFCKRKDDSTANPKAASPENAVRNESSELRATRLVQKPAWGLIITGLISLVTIPLAFWMPTIQNLTGPQRTIFQISFGVIPLVVGTMMAVAGFRMMRLEGYRLAMFAAVLPTAVLIFKLAGLSFGTLGINPADWVGAPIGLWVLMILSRTDVKAAFHRPRPQEQSGHVNSDLESFQSGRDEFAPYGDASSKTISEDFLLMNPRLPVAARWVTVYAIVVRPLLWILVVWLGFLGLMSSLAGADVELAVEHTVDVVAGFCGLMFVMIVAIGGVKLRAQRHNGPRWIKIGLGLGFGFGLLMFFVHLTFLPWFVGPLRWAARTNPELLIAEGFTQEEIAALVADEMHSILIPDAISVFFVLLWLALDIAVFIWLWRNSRFLPLSDAKVLPEPKPLEAAPAGPISEKRRGALGQAWDEWWAERDRWFTRTVLAVLVLVHVACLGMFLALRGGGGYDSGRRSAWHHVGWPSPWFVFELGTEPNVAFRRTIDLLSSSILIAVGGMLAWYIFWRIQLVRDLRNARFWRTIGSPTAVLTAWIIAGASFAWLGVRDANRLYESMPTATARAELQRAPELRTESQSLKEESKGAAEPVAPTLESAPELETFYALGQRAQEAFDRCDFNAVKTLAQDYLQLAEKYRDDWNYGNAIHDANVLLGRVAVAEGNLAAAKEHLLAAGKTTASPQLASFGPKLTLAAELVDRGERDAVLQFLAEIGTVWRSPEKVKRLVTTIKQGKTPPELNVVSQSHPLIGKWGLQGTRPENTAERHVVEINADGKGSLSIVREETQQYRIEGHQLILTNPTTGKEEKDRFEFREGQLVLIAPPSGQFAKEEIVLRRIGSATSADSLVGTWEGTLHIEDVGSATVTQTFDAEEPGQTTMQVRLSKPVSFFFSVIGDKMLWAPDADSAASPAEWRVTDDKLHLTNFLLPGNETTSVYQRER